MFLLTFCGYYCSFSSLVGVFFFLVIGIMEARKNPFLGEHVQKSFDYPKDNATKSEIQPDGLKLDWN